MKKSILVTLLTILSTNILFLANQAPDSIKESVQIQIREENSVTEIQPTGAWFTEDDELP